MLQSVLNSPHAYSQNKAFTKHIVDALIQSYEEKLELEVSIPRKLYDEWEPTIKIKIKDHECYALCDVLGFREFDGCSLNLHLWIPLLRNLWEELMMFLLLQIGIMCP